MKENSLPSLYQKRMEIGDGSAQGTIIAYLV